MKTALTFLFVLLLHGSALAQDLPPDILADQYLLEASKALEKGDTQAALRAFGKIEALDTDPPQEFAFFYGKMLVENSAVLDDLLKGQALLKEFVVSAGRGSAHYTPALELLSGLEAKLASARAAQRAAEIQELLSVVNKQMERIESGTPTMADLSKGQSLLKQFITSVGRDSEHYPLALERLSTVEAKLEAALAQILPEVLTKLNAQMERIEGGTLTMGCTREQTDCSDAEKPAHSVRVGSFEISKYEVTQEVWAAVMGANPSYFQGCAQCPVDTVSWDDIQGFLQKLNAGGGRYRLPSEAEWEYAARGGSQSRGYEYAGSSTPGAVAWYSENSGKRTHPVGQKQANELGLYDLSGNVYEWVQDCVNDNYRGAPTDGRAWESGDCHGRVLRGGSWYLYPRLLRSAHRRWVTADYRNFNFGFRIARSLP